MKAFVNAWRALFIGIWANALLLPLVNASAAVTTLTFTGALSTASGTFSVGEPVFFTFLYDTNAVPNFPPTSTFSSWSENDPMQVSVGGNNYVYNAPITIYYQNVGASDTIQFSASDHNTNVTISGLPGVPTLSLPEALELSTGSAVFYILSPDQTGHGGGTLTLTNISSAPGPNPGAGLASLAALAFAGLHARARRA